MRRPDMMTPEQNEPPATPAEELPGPMRPRRPEDFDGFYAGTPPWDIGRPQPAFLSLAEAGAIRGRVLDVGCGTGEHTLMAAGMGLEATGIDSSPAAIALAEAKARDRGLTAHFLVHDALQLASLDKQFDMETGVRALLVAAGEQEDIRPFFA